MKVLHVRPAGAADPAIVLHTEVSVVRTSDPTVRAFLASALGRVAESDLDLTGEIETHGIRMPFEPATLRLLGLTEAVNGVVRAGDLPGHDARIAQTGEARQATDARRHELSDELARHREALAAAVEEREAASSDVDEVRHGGGAARELLERAEAERAEAEADRRAAAGECASLERSSVEAAIVRDQAEADRSAATQGLDAARIAHREAIAAAAAAAAAVEETRSVSGEDPTSSLEAARQHLDRVEAAAAGDGEGGDGPSAVNRRLADLERRRSEVVRLREALGESDVEPLAEALDHLLSAGDEAQPVVAAMALADTWRDLHQQIRALDAGISPVEQEAEGRVVAARLSMVEAESDFNQPVLTPEQIARVEAAHGVVLEAQDRSDSRFGGGRARKKLDEARSEERRVLERLGFSTYADYMMSSSSRGIGPANRAILETARHVLTRAMDDLASLPGASDRARRRTELLQRRDAVAPRVAALIGHEPTGPEAEDELRELRETLTPDLVAMGELAARLEEVGLIVGPAPHEREDLVLLARSYLAEQRTGDQRRAEVAQAIGALDTSIDALRQAADRGDREFPDLPELPSLAEPLAEAGGDAGASEVTLREARWADVEAARRAVADAEAAVARYESAGSDLAELEAELARQRDVEEQAASAVEAAKAAATGADGPALEAARAQAAQAEEALERARESERAVAAVLADGPDRSAVEDLVSTAEQRLVDAEHAVTAAAAAEQATAGALAEAEAAHEAATHDHEAATTAAEEVDRAALVEEIDWALMGRLAQVRSVGLAGSVPLVLDDPFSALEDGEVTGVLDKVASLAGAVQVVVISDCPAIAEWAASRGPERALVVAA